MRGQSTDILVVGNYCHDTLVYPDREFHVLGGSSAYISSVFSALDLSYRVVAKVGKNFRYHEQVQKAPVIAPRAPTTHFVDDLRHGERTAVLRSTCDPIFPADIPEGSAKISLLCGVAMEITPETLLRVRAQSEIVVCDAQAILRDRNAQGEVIHRRLEETAFRDLVGLIDYLKVSETESRWIDLDLIDLARTRVIVTQDAKGSVLLEKGRETRISPYPVAEVDSTGAGDCFVAGLAHGLLMGLDPASCAKRGNYFGALAVQEVGVPDFKALELKLRDGALPAEG